MSDQDANAKSPAGPPARLILLMGPQTYRAGAFMTAARKLGVEVVPGVDIPEPLSNYWEMTLPLEFSEPEKAASAIVSFAADHPVAAIVAVDDGATEVAALAGARLGIAHNDPGSALAARDKLVMRRHFAAAGVPVPWFQPFPFDADPAMVAEQVPYPCVVKPTRLSGSRGVIRTDNPEEFVTGFLRTRALLIEEGADPEVSPILVEGFIPGFEVALEGLLTDGALQVLALFDKPDPLDGPFFEETIYVTPSRLAPETQQAIASATAQAAAAVGLRHGPVHAELRINADGVWPIELAGRSIGGLCSTILKFGAGCSLEEMILRHALSMPLETARRGDAVGVMMIPILSKGMLRCVEGIDEARAVPGITGLEISAQFNYPIVPLPEGASYLGFIFAAGSTPAEAEEALRLAHARLRIRIDPLIPLIQTF